MLDSLLCGLVKALGALLCRLSPGAAVRLGQAVGGLGLWLQPKRVRVGIANLHAAYGDRLAPGEARRIVRRIFRNLGAGVIEMLRLPAIDEAYIDRYVEILGRARFETTMAAGRPVILLTGHFGNWELSSIVAALKGHPILALARAQDKLPKLYALLVAYRESKGCRIVHKGGAMRQLLQALRQRQLVGIVGDQASRQGRLVEFFGRPALFATGPFALARATGALILPAFVHRVRGPHHRLEIEAPIDLLTLPGDGDAQVQAGIERFVQTLRAHIDRDPSQWLWLHKRWKHTPARQVVVLSDGKRGHVKQSLAVVRALQAVRRETTHRVLEIRYRRGGRPLALVCARLRAPGWLAWRVLRAAVTPESWRSVAIAAADILVSTGSSTAPVNVLLARLLRAKSVVVMTPSGLPLDAFDLAFVPVHDRPPARPHVVATPGALAWLDADHLRAEQQALLAHPRFRRDAAGAGLAAPVVAVLLGGDTDEYQVTQAFASAAVEQIARACERLGAAWLVTTSRRTPADVEQWLEQRVASDPRCRLLLRASRDHLNGTMDGMLGWARVVVVTGESISMVSEACAAGRQVVVIEPPVRAGVGETKARRFLRAMAERGAIRRCEVDALAAAVVEAMAAPEPAAGRVDANALLRDAVAPLLR